MLNHKDQYVYAYLDPRKAGRWETSVFSFLYEPIYIGEGKNARAWHHLKRKDRHHLVSKIKSLAKIGMEPIVMIVCDGLTGDEGLQLETDLIKAIGTRSKIPTVKRGPLTNLQLGEGKKRIVSLETKAKMSVSISKALMGHVVTDETRKKIGASYNRTPESSERRSQWQRGKKLSEHQKVALLESIKGIPKSDDQRKKMSASALGKPKSDDHKKSISLAMSKGWKITSDRGTEVTYTLGEWCKNNNIKVESLKSAYRRGLPFRGFVLEKL
jgi:hypothetical protein